MDRAAWSDRGAEHDRFSATGGQRRKISHGPCRPEQPALARVGLGHADAAVVGIGCRPAPIGIVAGADARGSDTPRLLAGDRFCRFDDRGHRLEGLHHRAVIGGMDDGRGREADVIEEMHQRSAPVELGEESMCAPADARVGKCHQGRPADRLERRLRRPGAARQDALQIGRCPKRQRTHPRPGGGARLGELGGFPLGVITTRERRFDRELGLTGVGNLPIGRDFAPAVPEMPQHLADDEPRPEGLHEA